MNLRLVLYYLLSPRQYTNTTVKFILDTNTTAFKLGRSRSLYSANYSTGSEEGSRRSTPIGQISCSSVHINAHHFTAAVSVDTQTSWELNVNLGASHSLTQSYRCRRGLQNYFHAVILNTGTRYLPKSIVNEKWFYKIVIQCYLSLLIWLRLFTFVFVLFHVTFGYIFISFSLFHFI